MPLPSLPVSPSPNPRGNATYHDQLMIPRAHAVPCPHHPSSGPSIPRPLRSHSAAYPVVTPTWCTTPPQHPNICPVATRPDPLSSSLLRPTALCKRVKRGKGPRGPAPRHSSLWRRMCVGRNHVMRSLRDSMGRLCFPAKAGLLGGSAKWACGEDDAAEILCIAHPRD